MLDNQTVYHNKRIIDDKLRKIVIFSNVLRRVCWAADVGGGGCQGYKSVFPLFVCVFVLVFVDSFFPLFGGSGNNECDLAFERLVVLFACDDLCGQFL